MEYGLGQLLYSQWTAYLFACILLFVFGLITFFCCRVWCDLFACRRRARSARPAAAAGNDRRVWREAGNSEEPASRLKLSSNERDEHVGRSSRLSSVREASRKRHSLAEGTRESARRRSKRRADSCKFPAVGIVVTSAEKVEEEMARAKEKLQKEAKSQVDVELGHQ